VRGASQPQVGGHAAPTSGKLHVSYCVGAPIAGTSGDGGPGYARSSQHQQHSEQLQAALQQQHSQQQLHGLQGALEAMDEDEDALQQPGLAGTCYPKPACNALMPPTWHACWSWHLRDHRVPHGHFVHLVPFVSGWLRLCMCRCRRCGAHAGPVQRVRSFRSTSAGAAGGLAGVRKLLRSFDRKRVDTIAQVGTLGFRVSVAVHCELLPPERSPESRQSMTTSFLHHSG
jgi:hypothetical protein